MTEHVNHTHDSRCHNHDTVKNLKSQVWCSQTCKSQAWFTLKSQVRKCTCDFDPLCVYLRFYLPCVLAIFPYMCTCDFNRTRHLPPGWIIFFKIFMSCTFAVWILTRGYNSTWLLLSMSLTVMIGVVLCSGLGHGRRWVIILLDPVHIFLLDPVTNFTWSRA